MIRSPFSFRRRHFSTQRSNTYRRKRFSSPGATPPPSGARTGPVYDSLVSPAAAPQFAARMPQRRLVACLCRVLVGAALGCKRDLGDCDLDGLTPEGQEIPGPAAFDLVYRITDGLPMYTPYSSRLQYPTVVRASSPSSGRAGIHRNPRVHIFDSLS